MMVFKKMINEVRFYQELSLEESFYSELSFKFKGIYLTRTEIYNFLKDIIPKEDKISYDEMERNYNVNYKRQEKVAA